MRRFFAHWKRLGDFTPEIRPLSCQLMPDHLHGILEVTRPMAKPLGNAIGGFKTGCEKIYRGLAPSVSPASGRRAFKIRFSFALGSSTRCSTTCATTRAGLRSSGFTTTSSAPSGSCGGLCRGWAAGRPLLLAPAAWPHVPGEKPMTRRDALVLNRLAQALAGDGAAEISYRGVTFAEVEVWAQAAVAAEEL